MDLPAPTDPEIAAAVFGEHLDDFFRNSPHVGPGWGRVSLDALHTIVVVPGYRADGVEDPYFVLLDGTWYDLWPPRVTFVEPLRGWPLAAPGSRWWPHFEGTQQFPFALHASYSLQTGETRPLVCFSHSFDYYFSSHTPTEEQKWKQGTHTVSATLSRLARVLRDPTYHRGPSGGTA